MDNEKKTFLMSTIATIALIAIVVGATYAYFEAQNETTGGANIGVDAATTDVFRLTSSDAIELNANPSNFKQGDANLVGEAQASAYLRANNNTNTATYNYYVYLDIEENDFVYSVDENIPELLLKVYEGEIGENEVTSIPGLTRKTTEDVTGFDITGITRAITIVDNKEITTTSEIEEKWSIEIIFVNLESDQKANQGKTLDASLRIESDNIGVQITEVTTSNITRNSITVNATVEAGQSEIASYIYGIKESSDDTTAMVEHTNIVRLADGDIDEEGYATYERTNPTFTFENLKSGTKYDIKITVKDEKGIESIKVLEEIETEIGLLTEKIKTLYTGTDGENNLYYHDGEGSYTNANLEAGDNSYRYAGSHSSVNNYVCFGIDEETCPAENLYRIIGVFNNGGEEQVKLIKWDFATNEMLGTAQATGNTFAASDHADYKGALTRITAYHWSGSSTNESNIWSSSTLNTIALNTNYMTYLGSEWTEMIAETTWKVGGNTYENIVQKSAKTAYRSEIVNPAVSTEYEDEIGLMYVSEYMYAASPTYWSKVGYNSSDATKDYRTAINNNWMHSGVLEWSITRLSNYSSNSINVNPSGVVYHGHVYVRGTATTGSGVRPVFNLKSNVTWIDGDGTKLSPYRVSL
ncbi:MAG: hypothetical protein E7172_03630 [Firmicutes bacterium]|nr:hypothetical protein [Bacillota bacterium]